MFPGITKDVQVFERNGNELNYWFFDQDRFRYNES